MTVEEIRGDSENFPVGMRVLAVDDDPICLKLLDTLLRKCQYHVTTTSQARMALKMLRENKERFDLVISDVHMPDMDGFKLLELVGLEMDLPVIMLSANSDPKLVMKGVTHGACDYLVKPVRIEELRNIWQHVIRRKKFDGKNQNKSGDQVKTHQASREVHGSPLTGDTDQNGRFNRKRKDEEDESEDNGNESEDPGTQKKPRVVWSIELHRKFVAAVNQLGIEKAVPKRILDLMNVDGLTRENVASHLQKYRLYLKRISSVASQQANMAAALGVKDSPFMRMGSLDGLGDFRTLSGARLANVGLSPFTTGGMLGRLNSPANVNLRNLTPSALIQPSQTQNLNSSITSLGKMHSALSPASPNASLFQGIPSSLELDQLQPSQGALGSANVNSIDDSRMFSAAIGSSSNLMNSSTNSPMMLNVQQVLGGGGFGNQSTHNMASFNAESFNAGVSSSSNLLDPGKCNENWQNALESSKMQPNPLLSTEVFHSQLPLNGSRDNSSSNGSYFQNNAIEFSSAMALPPFEDSRDMQCQESFMGDIQNMNQVPSQRWEEQSGNYAHSSNNVFGSLNSHIPGNGIVSPLGRSLDQNSGILNQKMDMFINGRSTGSASNLLQQNENEKSATEPRTRSHDDFPFEHPKLQGGYVPQSYDSLDELMNAMIKREQDETIPNCDFGFDDYSFGSGI
ncbi:two-component response regulator ARR12 [Sesamum indicum]|uniref:Two-component response regulator n=1 Tax=Sesamum indicum TaxID=4182 RepID=A0A6I9T482_SESIN|nr:two-component response regulator ARR12 [Sesamum indicum]